MTSSEYYGENIEKLRKGMIEDIFEKIKSANVIDIMLNNPPAHYVVDDEINAVVCRVDSKSESFWLDTGVFMYTVSSETLSTETLLSILQEIEDRSYEIFEE